MKSLLATLVITPFFLFPLTQKGVAQSGESVMFRLSEGFVRIAEPGQIADTLSVWGDINAPGRYIIPRGTTVHELISYARGPQASRSGGQRPDWNKVNLKISISRFEKNTGKESIITYEYKYSEPYPEELRQFSLQSDDIVGLEAERRPSFVDWIGVFSGIVSATATTIIVVDRLSQ